MSLILIVDDASYSRMQMIGALSKCGYQNIIQAQDGEEAVMLYVEYKPDIVLLDIHMPNLGGIEALQCIREVDKKAKVIIISSMGQEETVKKAVTLGASHFIVKPFKPDELPMAVKKVLGK
jgi:two-component system chemotaxis response regulator CheY